MIIELLGATHTTECTEEGTTVAGAGAGGLVVWLFIMPGGGEGAFWCFLAERGRVVFVEK